MYGNIFPCMKHAGLANTCMGARQKLLNYQNDVNNFFIQKTCFVYNGSSFCLVSIVSIVSMQNIISWFIYRKEYS